MEEKRYPKLEEEQSVGMVNEPMAEAVVASPQTEEGVTTVHDWIDDLDWDKFPSHGPFSEEEAIARIERAEANLKDPSKWKTSKQMWDRLYAKYPWLK